jgi:hypothetical protein
MQSKTDCVGAGFRPFAHNPSTVMGPASSACPSVPRQRLRSVPCWIALGLFALFYSAAPAAISLSHQEAMRIGRKIWQNESGGTVSGLTSWNQGENFASLGIGHFIWYPAGVRGPFEESFPSFLRYAESRGAKLPALLLGANGGACPWNSRENFLAAASSEKMKQLRTFLLDTIDLQADFLIQRLQEALPKMLGAVPATERSRIEKQFHRVASTPQGLYALIDYVNFKGEGVLPTERYRGRGWGLLQVLEGMTGSGKGRLATGDFADSAGRVLRERVKNSPPGRNEKRWLPGWLNRVESYRG